MSDMPKHYNYNLDQMLALKTRPRISGAWALDKGLWQGRKVAVVATLRRGDYRHHRQQEVYYGTLDLTAGKADQIGVVHPSGEVTLIHKTRARDVFDMTRTK